MRTQGRLMRQIVTLTSLMAILVGTIGCKSSPTRVSGRVIEGRVGQAMVIGQNDERLSEPGIPGVSIVVLHAGGSAARGKGTIGQTVSDDEGNFFIKIPGGKHPAASVLIRMKGESVFSARAQSYLPTNTQKLLCTVILRDRNTAATSED